MPRVLDWLKEPDPRAVVHEAVEALRSGQVVAFPTETVYGLAADAGSPEGVERLVHCKGRPEDKPMALALADPLDLPLWVPQLGTLARRLSRRCWPGPLTLVFSGGFDVSRLPTAVHRYICGKGTLGIRVPAHEAILAVIDTLGRPLVLTSANRSGEPDAVTGQQVADALGEAVPLVIDSGPTRYGKPSSVVLIKDDQWQMLREGVVSSDTLTQLSGIMILFVCTGNTCRSPLAETLCKKLLAERLGCSPDDLPRRGFLIRSAGLGALPGAPAAAEAVAVAQTRGGDLSQHVTRPLTDRLVLQADYVFAMTRSHLAALEELNFSEGPHLDLLCPDGRDIEDPLGGDRAQYESCAEQIESCLRSRLPQLLG